MKHLYIIVEGETELEFVKRILTPYLVAKGLQTHIQGLMITMSGGGHGFNNIEHFKNTIKPILSYQNAPVITTMIDHYAINSEKKIPNYSNCIGHLNVADRIQCMEDSLLNAVHSIKENYRFFIPNIIQHEMETLLFANPQEGFDLESDAIKNAVLAICQDFPNIEDINSTPQGAPSKRLIQIYSTYGKKYVKGAEAIDIAELTGLESILEKCPRFASWVQRVIDAVLETAEE